jgi:putative polyhydroxyalkanoate system protein
MPGICIRQPHKLSHKKARAAAQKVAHQMAKEFEMAAEWNGDVLLFKRAGVTGKPVLLEKQVEIEINLGLLFKAFAPTIEDKVAAKMKTVFAEGVQEKPALHLMPLS